MRSFISEGAENRQWAMGNEVIDLFFIKEVSLKALSEN